MKKTILLLTCAVLLSMSHAFATDITVQDAQSVAVNFFKTKLGNSVPRGLTATLKYTRTEADNVVDFYVFETSPTKGFVIVSATDNDEPIIGYSTESYFPTDFSKIGLNEILNRWSTELHYVKTHNVVATPTSASHWVSLRNSIPIPSEKAGVTPFCQTTWDQNTEYGTGPNLYNNFCPGGTGTNQAVTGCVATTMAQIMKYWSYPPVGIGSNSYEDDQNMGYQSNYGILSANFADSTFSWANMPATLTNQSTTTQINAIGRLMACAGISVDMDYSPNGSGAVVLTSQAGGGPSAQDAYVTNFGYQTIIQGLLLSGTGTTGSEVVSSAVFTDSIEVDLARGRLVQVQGTDPTNGGHTWVCDGYETSPSVMFHMNWGWSGYADGYFAINAMNPNDGQQLTFSQDIGVLIHIVPPIQSGGSGHISELASATVSAVCAGTPTQLTATTHSGATYSWSPTTNLSNANISNPVATPTTTTTYTVTADSAGVTATSSVTITVHAKPTTTIPTAVNVSCYGNNTGSATASVTGGTAAYHYVWNNGETTAQATNLIAGTYTVTVTDANSCSSSATKTITQPSSALTASMGTPVNAGCGQANGSVTTNVTGGTLSYHYSWSNGATSSNLAGLAAGNYSLTVTDAHSCSVTANAVISSSSALNVVASSTNVNCYGGSNGSATLNVSGATGGLSYTWSNGATTAGLTGVAAGNYSVTIVDASQCSAATNLTVTQPNAMQVSTAETDAHGTVDNGTAMVTNISGGVSPFTYYWSNGGTTQTITGIAPGNYTVTVTDANGCVQTASDFVNVTTGLNNISNAIAFSVYPNPAGKFVMVQMDEYNSSTTVSLKNILGQTVITQPVTAQQTQLELGSLANGVYLVELRQNEKIAVKQLVIVK